VEECPGSRRKHEVLGNAAVAWPSKTQRIYSMENDRPGKQGELSLRNPEGLVTETDWARGAINRFRLLVQELAGRCLYVVRTPPRGSASNDIVTQRNCIRRISGFADAAYEEVSMIICGCRFCGDFFARSGSLPQCTRRLRGDRSTDNARSPVRKMEKQLRRLLGDPTTHTSEKRNEQRWHQ